MASAQSVSVRMYNIGFGDAFLVTARRGAARWRMLVDCGVHSQSVSRPLEESVTTIIADITADCAPLAPHLDVIVATHHHADHIAGFRFDAWEAVSVGEVWVPFVEDEGDPDAIAIRKQQKVAAAALMAMIDNRKRSLGAKPLPAALAAAEVFAANSSGNQTATERLLGEAGRHFANKPLVRFLPERISAANTIPLAAVEGTAHILGPSRDPAFLKRMDPPKKAGWLALSSMLMPDSEEVSALFDQDDYVMTAAEVKRNRQLTEGHQAIDKLDGLNDEGLLAAASVLESAVNNTSVFMVLDIAGLRMVFPGDAQQGAWEHIFADDNKVALISNVDLYKISHHGSGNGTPRRYVEELLVEKADLMLSWGLVKRWKDTIPNANLMTAVAHHPVIRVPVPVPDDKTKAAGTDRWTQINFTRGSDGVWSSEIQALNAAGKVIKRSKP